MRRQTYHQKIANIYKERRKERNSVYFQMQRSIIMNQSDQQSIHSQNQILLLLKNYRLNAQPLNFELINNYFCTLETDIDQELKLELAKIILSDFKTNGHAIASLGHALNLSKSNQSLLSLFGLADLIQDLLETNLKQNNARNNGHGNEKPLIWLLFNLLSSFPTPQAFASIKPYYNLFITRLGTFDTALLYYFTCASKYRILLPQPNFIQSLLKTEIYEDQLLNNYDKISELLQNYIRLDQTHRFHLNFFKWSEKLLKHRKIPESLKIELIKLITSILRSHNPESAEIGGLVEADVFLQINAKAQYGTLNIKISSVECICQRLLLCKQNKLVQTIEQNSILPILVYGFDLPLPYEIIVKQFQAICYIIAVRKKYCQELYNLGIQKIVDSLIMSDNSAVVAAATTFLDLQK